MDIVNGVIIGDDDYLFLAHGGHHVLEVITGRREISDETIRNFRDNLLFRKAEAERAGSQYRHVIFPDKQSVLVEQFPVKDFLCLGDVHLQRSPEIRDIVFYPLALLRANDSVFRKTDTHLTDYGSALVAAALAEAFTGEDQAHRLEAIVARAVEQVEDGDLGGRFTPPRSVRERYLRSAPGLKCFMNKLAVGNNGIVDICITPGAPYRQRVVWFGDSFGRNCVRQLANYFREIVFLRTPFFHPDIFWQIKPDILITQNVERYLEGCKPDDERPSFFMYPHLSGREYTPEQAFAEAFSAVLSYPRKPYQDFITAQAG